MGFRDQPLRGFDANAFDYITKPIETGTLPGRDGVGSAGSRTSEQEKVVVNLRAVGDPAPPPPALIQGRSVPSWPAANDPRRIGGL